MDLITPDFGLIFWQTVTLLVVLWILGKFAWKPILHTIQEREEYVEKSLQAAEEAKQLVEQLKANKATLRQTAQKEREKLIAEAMITKAAIIEEAKAEAEKVSEKAVERTKVQLAREKEEAVAALKNEVAALSVQVAEKLLQSELHQKSQQEALVQKLIKEAHWN